MADEIWAGHALYTGDPVTDHWGYGWLLTGPETEPLRDPRLAWAWEASSLPRSRCLG